MEMDRRNGEMRFLAGRRFEFEKNTAAGYAIKQLWDGGMKVPYCAPSGQLEMQRSGGSPFSR